MIQKFVNEQLGCEIRVVERDGQPWFVAKDVAEALGYHPKKITQTLAAHCKGVTEMVTQVGGQGRKTLIIPEADLYRLIMRSQKPEAEAFQDWVTETVLPSIRKNGAYMTPHTLQEMLRDPQTIISLLDTLRQETETREYFEARDEIFGNRIPYGAISHNTGKPRIRPVRGYLRSLPDGYEFVPDTIQLRLF